MIVRKHKMSSQQVDKLIFIAGPMKAERTKEVTAFAEV